MEQKLYNVTYYEKTGYKPTIQIKANNQYDLMKQLPLPKTSITKIRIKEVKPPSYYRNGLIDGIGLGIAIGLLLGYLCMGLMML